MNVKLLASTPNAKEVALLAEELRCEAIEKEPWIEPFFDEGE